VNETKVLTAVFPPVVNRHNVEHPKLDNERLHWQSLEDV
jgi:hypothetical protein